MGRYSYSRRGILENSAGITIRDLLWMGGLKRLGISKANFSITSSRTGSLGNVSIQLEMKNKDSVSRKNFIQFYINGKPSSLHLIESQPVYLGGVRYYFKCSYCCRRVKALYFGQSQSIYACRHCLGLVYQRSRSHRDWMDSSYAVDKLKKEADKLMVHGHPRLAGKKLIQAQHHQRRYNAIFSKHVSKYF